MHKDWGHTDATAEQFVEWQLPKVELPGLTISDQIFEQIMLYWNDKGKQYRPYALKYSSFKPSGPNNEDLIRV